MNRIDQFLHALEMQKKQGPHKPVLILAVLDMIALHGKNQFPLGDELRRHFTTYFNVVREGNDDCNPNQPFWYMKTSRYGDPIWDHAVVRENEAEYMIRSQPGVSKNLSNKWLENHVEYAHLSLVWFSLLQNQEARNTVRNAIAHRYFPAHAAELIALSKEAALPVLFDSPFAPIDPGQLILQNEYAVAFYDRYPVSEGHALVVPKRVVPSVYDLPKVWQTEMWNTVRDVRATLGDWYAPAAYNIGINDGEAAGQTINHTHIHVIPRYSGDQPDPRGGIRKIFPEKANYWNEGTGA
ncbi:HIT family protein [Pontiella sp.]|uniref:HIT family protein n=1 Tax=Pontiella sp. TaxID=2837462 RepID=UPI003566E1D3